MRSALAALFCIAAIPCGGPAAGAPKETIGIGSEHYGHDWRKDRDEVRGRRSYCKIILARRDGELKRVKRCY